MAYSFKSKRERDRARQQAAVNRKEKVKVAVLKLALAPKAVELPKATVLGIQDYFTNTHGERRWFELVLRMSDGKFGVVELDMDTLKALGTGITSLRQTRVFKDWVNSKAGREYIEAQVNAK